MLTLIGVSALLSIYVALRLRAIVRIVQAELSSPDKTGSIAQMPFAERLAERAFHRRDRMLCEALRKHLSVGAKICDVGCGDGRLLHRLENEGYEAYGIELDINMVYRARSALRPDRIAHGDLLTAWSDVQRLDAVLFCDSLRYMSNPRRMLVRAIELGRIVAITEPYSFWHLAGRILLLHFLYRVDHVSRIELDGLPIVGHYRGLFHRVWILSSNGSGLSAGALNSCAGAVTGQTLIHPKLEARLGTIAAASRIASLWASLNVLIYVLGRGV